MAAVPILDQPTTSLSTGRTDKVSAPPVDDQSGAQFQQLGNAITQTSSVGLAIAGDMQRRADATRVDEANNQLARRQNELVYNEADGLLSLRGADAINRPDGVDLSDEYGGRLSAAFEEISAGLGNRRQRAAFRLNYLARDASLRERASQHQLTEFNSYSQSVAVEALDVIGTDILEDDADVPALIAAAQQHGEALAGARGEAGPAAERYARDAISSRVSAEITTRLANDDFDGAVSLFDRLAPHMTPEAVAATTARIEPEREYRLVDEITQGIIGNVVVEHGADEVGAVREGDAPADTTATATPREARPPTDYASRFPVSSGGGYTATRGGGRQHRAEDFAMPNGTPVAENQVARVVRVRRNAGEAGNYVALEFGNGVIGRYLHLSDINVREGDILQPGQVFGASGDSGSPGAFHLHREFRRGGGGGIGVPYINPATLGELAPYTGEGSTTAQAGRGDAGLAQALEVARNHPELADNPARRDAVERRIEQHYSRIERADNARDQEAQDAVLRYYQQNPNARWENLPAEMRAAVAPRDVASLMNRGDAEEDRAYSAEERRYDVQMRPQRRAAEQQRFADAAADRRDEARFDRALSLSITNPTGFAGLNLNDYRRATRGDGSGVSDADYLRLRAVQESIRTNANDPNNPWTQVRQGVTALGPEIREAALGAEEQVEFNVRFGERVIDATRANQGRALNDEQLRQIGIDLLGQTGPRSLLGLRAPPRNFTTDTARRPRYQAIPAPVRAQIRRDFLAVNGGITPTEEQIIGEYVRRTQGGTQ